MWKNLSADAKENYYSASRKADEEHKRKYPGYYYSPKEARIRKNMKSLESGRSGKRPLDAMHLVKLVMTEHCDINPRRSSSEHEKEESEDDEMEETVLRPADEMDVIKEETKVADRV